MSHPNEHGDENLSQDARRHQGNFRHHPDGGHRDAPQVEVEPADDTDE